MKRITRRTMIKAAGASAAALSLARLAKAQEPFDPGGRVRVTYDETVSFNALYGFPPALGRLEAWWLRIHTHADAASDSVRQVKYSDVLPIYGAVNAEPPAHSPHNPIWYDAGEGFIHSSHVVPVQEVFHPPQETIGRGFWGEITVPTSWQHWTPALLSKRYYDLAYGAVFRVIDRADEPDGRAWYRLLDDANPSHQWWVQASHVRRIHVDEFEPISPQVDPSEKLIEVLIEPQLLTCYEGSRAVFSTRIASGTSFRDAAGTVHNFSTPYGEHYIQRKTPTRHMAGGEDINDMFDLPGVPWVTFFTPSGAAIHGTYWHNDYGRPRSHGCINVTPDAARWVYRWSLPSVDHMDDYYWTPKEEREAATRIVVKHDREA